LGNYFVDPAKEDFKIRFSATESDYIAELGLFEDFNDAVAAYNNAALRLRGKFAVITDDMGGISGLLAPNSDRDVEEDEGEGEGSGEGTTTKAISDTLTEAAREVARTAKQQGKETTQGDVLTGCF